MRLRGPCRFLFMSRICISRILGIAALSFIPRLAFAQEGASLAPEYTWTWDPVIVFLLLASAWLYIAGVVRARCTSHNPRIFAGWQLIAFVLGWLTLIVALISPVHELGESLFSAHMLQHELLMVVAAPLLIVGRPDLVFIWALPLSWRKDLARFQHISIVHRSWRLLAFPLSAWLLHAMALWTWHIPSLFDATIAHNWVHALQHSSFLGTALLFWSSLLYGHMGRRAYGEGIIYVFTTAVHTSILGALLTFAASPWYLIYEFRTAIWGLTALQDQQLGGLIMWVPAGLVYTIMGLWLLGAWIRDSDRRTSFVCGGAIAKP